MIRKILILIVVLVVSANVFAQTKSIHIEATDQPLNAVLLQLREHYYFQFSYSDNELSKYKITLSKTFNSKDETIKYLLKDLPFQLRKLGDVYIIIPDKKRQKFEEEKKPVIQIMGQIVEAGSYEPLPFSHIIINNHPIISDVTGNFNFTASTENSFRVRISHLGYYVYDTILYSGINQQFKLTPSIEKLKEIVVQNNIVEKSTMVGEQLGKITLNHNIARYIPGQGDNSVFNLVRLMPGIQAAGEQSTDLLIWGSYEGQSLVTFDEFTIFGLKNYNDNISVANPFVVKNIEVLKGGFDAKYGNRVGGIVNITGKNGNLLTPVFSFNINQTTLNGMVEIPLFKKSALLLAYRQTYYNLYNRDDFNIFAPTRPRPKDQAKSSFLKNVEFDVDIYPDDYQFRDLNLKYSYNFGNGDKFYVSMYGGGDFFKLATDADLTREGKGKFGKPDETLLTLSFINTEENKQRGLSTFYSKNWTNNISSKFIISHSDFTKKLSDEIRTENKISENIYKKDLAEIENNALENSIRNENLITLLNGHQIEFGGGIYSNETKIDFKTNIRDTLHIDNLNVFNNRRMYGYFQDVLPVGSRLILKTGGRLNISNNRLKLHFEPRINASFIVSEPLKINASFGRFHQFMYKIANVDRDKNYSYLWVTSNDNIPVLNATHWITGINYFKNNFTINIEGYYKRTRNLSQRVFEQQLVNLTLVDDYFMYFGDAKTYGIDFYAKKDFKNNAIWASYTISKTLERLAPLRQKLPDYSLAPHHQLHEFKIAALVNVRNFYISANYVYGSGMEILREVFADETDNVSYNRVDAAVTYRFSPKKFTGEVGLSVLNLFDTQNLKYANIKNIRLTPDLEDIRIYSDAVPFTPTLFLKFVF